MDSGPNCEVTETWKAIFLIGSGGNKFETHASAIVGTCVGRVQRTSYRVSFVHRLSLRRQISKRIISKVDHIEGYRSRVAIVLSLEAVYVDPRSCRKPVGTLNQHPWSISPFCHFAPVGLVGLSYSDPCLAAASAVRAVGSRKRSTKT